MGIKNGDMEQTRAPLDFIGINLYYRTIAASASTWSRVTDPKMWLFPATRSFGSTGPHTDLDWEVWPDALYEIVMRISKEYDRPAIEITENGCAYGDAPDSKGLINDISRIKFYRSYLAALHRAISEGANVRGFHAWTLTDNFGWECGYSARFGLVWTDFKTQERIIKASGRWYGEVAKANSLPL